MRQGVTGGIFGYPWAGLEDSRVIVVEMELVWGAKRWIWGEESKLCLGAAPFGSAVGVSLTRGAAEAFHGSCQGDAPVDGNSLPVSPPATGMEKNPHQELNLP